MATRKTAKIARRRPMPRPVPARSEPDMRMELAPMPATFAGMLRADIKIRRVLKLPPWLHFPPLNERRDQAALSEIEHERFLCAFNVLNNNGTLGQLVDIHAQPHQLHHTLRFLPWHRVYLLKLEQALQAIHPDVTLPY